MSMQFKMTGKYKKMKKQYFNFIGAITAAIALSACNTSSPTYGTGSSNQAQTLKGISSMLALTPEDAPDINYNARPDLVVPSNQDVLPQPVDTQALARPADWPETPEQRIAAAHAAAPQGDTHWRGNQDLPTEYLTDTNKAGIAKETQLNQRSRKVGSGKGGASGDLISDYVKSKSSKDNPRDAVLAKRDQLAYSTGIKRKFLTEPPTEYRTPSANAEAGDLGVSNKEIEDRIKQQKKEALNTERGVIAPGS